MPPGAGVSAPVYPRVCGGTHLRHLRHHFGTGLSPRVRGNRTFGTWCRPIARSIPACAGEPYPRPGPRPTMSVYPRVCGGTVYRHHFGTFGTGLSPRVRGNQLTAPAPLAVPRSIPACAGEPRAPESIRRARRVYPRVCGGTGARVNRCMERPGLSPRVRGNPLQMGYLHHLEGSIPACAGEPTRLSNPHRFGGVYPRVCGGTAFPVMMALMVLGLSPRVRGNRK